MHPTSSPSHITRDVGADHHGGQCREGLQCHWLETRLEYRPQPSAESPNEGPANMQIHLSDSYPGEYIDHVLEWTLRIEDPLPSTKFWPGRSPPLP